jgi:hypothetical protein
MLARWEAAIGGVPVIDSSFLVSLQHGGELANNLPRARRGTPQQLREDFPQARHGQSRRFFSCARRSWQRNHNARSDRVM